MLFRLEIENFFSVAERLEIDFSLRVPDEDPHFAAIYPNSKKRAPKVVAVFGPNASGKTVFLRAIAFLAWFARDSFFSLSPTQPLPAFQFKKEDWAKKPTRLAVEIGLRSLFPGREAEAGVYRYGLEIQGQEGSVTKESLFYHPSTERKPFLVFERGCDGIVQGSDLFPIFPFKSETPPIFKVRSNASVISTYAQLGHQIAIEVHKALQTVWSNLLWVKEDLSVQRLISLFQKNPKLLEDANRELRRLDLGLLELTLSSNDLTFIHEGLTESIPWVFESNGTQSFLRSYPALWIALGTGGIAVLDELDASIHPEVLREIVSWFWDPETNPLNAQLFFSCHNILLLKELQKEEILFCKQTPKEGYTRMYRLADIKDIPKGEDFVRGYWHGAYGALPNIG